MKKTCTIEPEEYKALSAVLKQKLDLSRKRTVVIKKHTNGEYLTDEELAHGLYEAMGIRDIMERNREPHELENRFALEANIVLLSEEEIEASGWVTPSEEEIEINGWSPSGCWSFNKFQGQYDNSPIVEVSRASFDRDYTWAFLYFGLQTHSEVAFGSYFLLENRQGTWTINTEVQRWKS